MSLTPNERLLKETHSQLNDKASWLFTHIADTILGRGVEWFGFDGKKQTGGRKTTSLAAFLGWIDSGLHAIMTGINTANSALAGLQAAVEALGKKQGIDPVELSKLIDAAVEKSADKHLGDIGTYQLTKIEEKK